jgi:hypothetical protein
MGQPPILQMIVTASGYTASRDAPHRAMAAFCFFGKVKVQDNPD